jgi:DNA-binding NarL/FixJ family response regulator
VVCSRSWFLALSINSNYRAHNLYRRRPGPARSPGGCPRLSSKNSLHKELLDTIRAVHAGRKNLSPEVSFELAEHAAEETLSPLEVRVLRLIADGNSNKEIAAMISVAEDSVKGHVRNILSKLGANDRTQSGNDRR